jgi:hypothetical protein
MWFIFTLYIFSVGTAGIILQAPTLYDTRTAIDTQLSAISYATIKPPEAWRGQHKDKYEMRPPENKICSQFARWPEAKFKEKHGVWDSMELTISSPHLLFVSKVQLSTSKMMTNADKRFPNYWKMELPI